LDYFLINVRKILDFTAVIVEKMVGEDKLIAMNVIIADGV
jgi:hypothetical protein